MSDSQQGLCLALGVVFMILPILAVGARTLAITMRKTNLHMKSIHADDYLIFLALIFAEIGGAFMLDAAVRGNLGQHLTYTHSQEIPDQYGALEIFLKDEYIISLFAQFSILAAKLSLLALYRRIFITRTFRLTVVIVGSIVVVWHTVFILLFILQCLPVQASWNLELAATAKCVDKMAVWKAYAISDVLTDSLVLSLPVPAILALQMSTRKKISVIMMFLLGAVVIGTGITRTVFFFIIAKDSLAQITYDAAPCMYWSFIETSLAVVGACLPALRPLFVSEGADSLRFRIQGFMSFMNSGGSSMSPTPPADNRSVESLKPIQVFSSRSVAVEAA